MKFKCNHCKSEKDVPNLNYYGKPLAKTTGKAIFCDNCKDIMWHEAVIIISNNVK